MGHAGHVKNHAGFSGFDQFINFLAELGAFWARVKATFDFQGDHAWLDSSSGNLQDHEAMPSSPSYGNWRMSRTQSPSAEKIEVPQPHGTNEADF